MEIDSFMAEYFTRKPLHIAAQDIGRLDELRHDLNDFDVEELLESTASESINVWIDRTDQKIDAVSIQDSGAAFKLFEAGFSTYCRCPRELEDCIIPQMLNSLGMGFMSCENRRIRRGEIELFCTHPGHVTDW